MGLGPDIVQVEEWTDEVKTRGWRKKKTKKDDFNENPGCWIRFNFMRTCIPSKPKVETSVGSGCTTHGKLSANVF